MTEQNFIEVESLTTAPMAGIAMLLKFENNMTMICGLEMMESILTPALVSGQLLIMEPQKIIAEVLLRRGMI